MLAKLAVFCLKCLYDKTVQANLKFLTGLALKWLKQDTSCI
jgi:hypothetical protein